MPGHLTSIEPVRKTVTVPTAPPRAFELFTAHIQEWWPLETHSVGEQQAAGIAFGEGVGGAIIETLADGTTSVWGTVTDWEPPDRVAFTWHAGTLPAEATRVEVTFAATGPAIPWSGWSIPAGSAAPTAHPRATATTRAGSRSSAGSPRRP